MILVLPTPRGWVFLFAAAGSLAVAFVNVGLATALTASCLTGFVVAGFLLALPVLFNIEVSRGANRDCTKGGNAILPVVVANNSRRYRQSLVIREKCPFAPEGRFNCAIHPLAPGEHFFIERSIPALKRGHYHLRRLSLVGGDPAGLFYRKRNFDLPAEVIVYPETPLVTWLPLRLKNKAMPEAEGRPLGISGQGQELFGIREYRHGDEIRFVHWKATAAKRQIMVKEFEASTVDQVTILLDSFHKNIGLDFADNNFEFLIRTVAGIINYLSEMYCRTQFLTALPSGTLAHLTGDSAGMKPRLTALLASLQPARMPCQDALAEILELIPPGSIFYCLTMSESPELLSALEILPDRDIDVKWIYSPKQYFPAIDYEKPRRIRKGKIGVVDNSLIKPFIANFNTDIARMLRND